MGVPLPLLCGPSGGQVCDDDPPAGDPFLTFNAAAAGDYVVRVSAGLPPSAFFPAKYDLKLVQIPLGSNTVVPDPVYVDATADANPNNGIGIDDFLTSPKYY